MGDCLGTAGTAGTGLVIQYAAQGRVDWEKYGQTQMFLNDTHFYVPSNYQCLNMDVVIRSLERVLSSLDDSSYF